MNRYIFTHKKLTPEVKPGQVWVNRFAKNDAFYIDAILIEPTIAQQPIAFYPCTYYPTGRGWMYVADLQAQAVFHKEYAFDEKTKYEGQYKPVTIKQADFKEPIIEQWVKNQDFKSNFPDKTELEIIEYLRSKCRYE